MKQLEKTQLNAVKGGCVPKILDSIQGRLAGTNATITPVVAPIEDGASCNVGPAIIPIFIG